VRRSLIRKGQTLRLVPLSASLWFLLGRYDQGTGSIARTLSNVESIIRVRVHVRGIRIWSHPAESRETSTRNLEKQLFSLLLLLSTKKSASCELQRYKILPHIRPRMSVSCSNVLTDTQRPSAIHPYVVG
jgi:hypothetical protein